MTKNKKRENKMYFISDNEYIYFPFTNIKKLNMEDRKWEIARLHGGVHITDLTLASAQDQLESSLEYKRKHRRIKEN